MNFMGSAAPIFFKRSRQKSASPTLAHLVVHFFAHLAH
jgi:hypothetical protein